MEEMALSATIFKIQLNIADTDRGYYGDHNLTIARHPSETDERMMVRVLAFIIHAHERLQFTKGLSADDEPDLWQKTLTDDIELWINVGQPDEKRLRKACSRSPNVFLYLYGGRTADNWWQQNEEKLARFEHLSIVNLPKSDTEKLASLVERTMQLQCTIQDNQIWINNGNCTVEVNPMVLVKSK
jgi:uncharacterized protein YaeQ